MRALVHCHEKRNNKGDLEILLRCLAVVSFFMTMYQGSHLTRKYCDKTIDIK